MATRVRLTAPLLVCLLLFFVLPAPVQRSVSAADALDGFDAFVETVMAEWKIPGVAVGAIKDGKLMLAKGYGFRDVGRQLPVTDQTLMAIGSNTKSFTVTLLGMLSDEEKLDWDRPIREYLADFQLHDDVATRLMTATDLVTHRSGLPRHDRMWFGSPFSRQEMYERLKHLEPSATFRQRYQYNNLMFMTAGLLAERITKQPWDEQIRQRIFMPLGMTRSNTSVRDTPRADDYALPYMERAGTVTAVPFRNIDAVGPAGSINSNVDEMLRYVQMHIEHGTAPGRQLISKRFAARMQSAHSSHALAIDLDAPVYTEMGPGGYGLGVNVRSYRGHKLVDHGGAIDGFMSAMGWMPDAKVGVVVLTNLSGTNPAPNVIALNVYERLLGLSLTDHVARAKAAQERNERQGTEREQKREAERVPGTSPSRPLAQFAGTYEHPAYGTLTIAERNGRLLLMRGFDGTAFEHFHFDVFRSVATPNTRPWTPRDRITFGSGASGRIESVAVPLEPAIAPIVFKRKVTTGTTSSF